MTGLAFGLMAAVGVYLLASSLFAAPHPASATALGDRLGALSTPLFGQDEARRAQPMLDRLINTLFGRAGARLGGAFKSRDADDFRLRMAGYPNPFTSVEAYYTYKVAIAIWMLVLGAVAGMVIALFLAEAGSMVVPMAVFMSVMGFFVPDLSVGGAAARRREQTIAEMASALGRLAIFVEAGNRLEAAIREVGNRPGGPFVHELRLVAADYTVSGDLKAGLDAMMQRYPLSEITAFAGRMKVALEQGGSVGPALQTMGQDMNDKLNLILEERGGRNTLLMVAPMGMAVMSGLSILVAPGAVTAIQMFSSAM